MFENPKWLLFILTGWIICASISIIVDGAMAQEASVIGQVMSQGDFWSYITAIGKVVAWDYSFFQGGWSLIAWIVFRPMTLVFTIMVAWNILKWVRGVM